MPSTCEVGVAQHRRRDIALAARLMLGVKQAGQTRADGAHGNMDGAGPHEPHQPIKGDGLKGFVIGQGGELDLARNKGGEFTDALCARGLKGCAGAERASSPFR